MQLPSTLLSPSPKNKKIHSEKFLIFSELEISSSIIRKLLYFPKKKAFLIFLELKPDTFWSQHSKVFPKKIS